MKFLVTLTATTPLSRIPWETLSAYTAWIYRSLNYADPALGDRVHANNPQSKTAIRGFSVSPLQFDQGQANLHGFLPESPFATLTLGTFDDDIAHAWLEALPAIPLTVGDMAFKVINIIPLPSPIWPTDHGIHLTCHPIALRDHPKNHQHPIFPRDTEWLPLLKQNLAHKAQQFLQHKVDPATIDIGAEHGWKARYQRPYGFPIPSFLPYTGMTLTAPDSSIYDVAYTLGLGVMNSATLGVMTVETATILSGLIDYKEA